MSRLNGPDNSPYGWTDLWKVVGIFGMTCFGKHWINVWPDGFADAVESEASNRMPKIIDDVVKFDDRGMLSEFCTLPLIRCLSSALASGKIRSGYAPKGGGELIQMPPAWWRTDNHFLRFKGWGVNADEPFNKDAELTCWVFLNQEDLLKVMDEIKLWLSSLPTEPIFDDDGYLSGSEDLAAPNYFVDKLPLRIAGMRKPLIIWSPAFPNFNTPVLVSSSPDHSSSNSDDIAPSLPHDVAEPVFQGKFKEILEDVHKEFLKANGSKTLNAIFMGHVDAAQVLCKSTSADGTVTILRRHYNKGLLVS